jgi:Ni,Fe-hydrogenase III component G
MAKTYQTFYKNEVRALQITVRDQDGNAYSPSAAYVEVQDNVGQTVVPEQVAQVTDNTVQTLIGTATTASSGTYNVIWLILYQQYTYYHVTELEVRKLL